MSTFDDMDKALQAGHKSAFNKDTQPGTTVSGTITGSDYRQVTDYSTKQPAYFPSGDPKMQIVINIHTGLRDNPDDDGERSIYIPMWGAKKYALLEAIKAAGMSKASEAFAPGNVFSARFVGEERKQGPTGTYTEKVYQYRVERGQQGAQALDDALRAPQAPASSPWGQAPQVSPQGEAAAYAQNWAPAQSAQQPATAQGAAPAPAPQQGGPDVQAMIRVGLTDAQIAAATGVEASVISIVRTQMGAAA